MRATVRLGIDVACRADHQASLAAATGELLWSGHRFRTRPGDLEELWGQVPEDAEVMVVLEPTRNAWVPLAAWLQAKGATVVLVPPEQSADLRDYYHKHTKTDRLDSRVLARLPLLHPDGDLIAVHDLGPAVPLKRAVRRRSVLVKRRSASFRRLDALLELFGPAWNEVLGAGDYPKTALVVLERYADPRTAKRVGVRRLTPLLVRESKGQWREEKARQIIAAANEAIKLWEAGGLDFAELAADVAAEARLVRHVADEIAALNERIDELYAAADPDGIVVSTPGAGVTLAAGILGRTGDLSRFRSLAGIRAFTGLVPRVDQSGNRDTHGPPTKHGDPGLREALFLTADRIRKADPTLAARYYRLVVDEGKHHNSALCHIAATLITRIAAAWRAQQPYQLRDIDGRHITEAEGRHICATRYAIPVAVRARRRSVTKAKKLKKRDGSTEQEVNPNGAASMPTRPTPSSQKPLDVR